MPAFYFDTFDGSQAIRDDTGLDLPDTAAAREVAHITLPGIARDRMPDGYRRDFIVDIRDAEGIVIYTCSLLFTARWMDNTPIIGDDDKAMRPGLN